MRFGFYRNDDGSLIEEFDRNCTLEDLLPGYQTSTTSILEIPEGKRAAGMKLVEGVLIDDVDLDTDAKTRMMVLIRNKRNELMAESDWTQLPDVLANGRLSSEEVATWATYRQNLADIPGEIDWNEIFSLSDIQWPAKPGQGE